MGADVSSNGVPLLLAGVALGLGALGTGMAFLISYYLLQGLGATCIPNVAQLIGWAAGEIVDVLEIAAIALVLTSIAMLQIDRQRALKQPKQPAKAMVKPQR